MVSHPITLLFIQNGISTFILMFTTPSSLIRPALLVLIVIGILGSLLAYLERVGRVPWAALLAGNTILAALQDVELSLLRKWTFQNEGRRLFVDRR